MNIAIEIIETSTRKVLMSKHTDTLPLTRQQTVKGFIEYVLDTELCTTGKPTVVQIVGNNVAIIELEHNQTKYYSLVE